MNLPRLVVSIVAMAALLVVFSGCSREGMETSERLAGTWTVNSFVESGSFLGAPITSDILEVDSVSSFTMEFTDNTSARGNVGRGDFVWDMVAEGTTYVLEGTYEVTAEPDQIDMTFNSGSWAELFVENPANQLLVFNYAEDGSTLSLAGNINSFTWQIGASR